MGQSLGLLVFYLIMNVLVYILISAFVIDDVIIGNQGTNSLLVGDNETASDVSVSEARTWLSSFTNIIFGIPWWATTLWIFLDITLLMVIILGFLRGI